MKKTLMALGLILVAVIVYFLLSKGESKEPKSEETARVVSPGYVAAEGKVEAMPGLEVEVGSELDGKIADFFVEEGDDIRKGELIAGLENRDIQAKLKEAEAELTVAKARLKEVASGAREEEIQRATATLEGALADMEMAKKELERYEQLFRKGVIPKALFDEKERVLKVAMAKVKVAEEGKRLLEKGPKQETLELHQSSVKRAEASVEYYHRLLEKTFIKAPISGKVIRKYLQKGEMISKEMQTSLVALAETERVRINAEVDETDIGRIQIGDPAEVISSAYPGKVFKGVVQEIAEYVGTRGVKPNNPVKNLDMKVVKVKIELKEKTPLRLGMTVDVKIIPQEETDRSSHT
ncbi:MAG: efflux RND transporter periplasmic adaptor subunit [Thermodesulfobacteriota bacterium]